MVDIIDNATDLYDTAKDRYDELQPGTYEHPETGETVEVQGSAPIFATAIGGPVTKAPQAGRYLVQYGDDVVKGGAALGGAAAATIGLDKFTDGSTSETTDMEKYLSGGYSWQETDVQSEIEEEMGRATYSEGGGGDPDDFTNDRQSVDTRPWYTRLKVKLAGVLSTFGLGWLIGNSDGNGGPLDDANDAIKKFVSLFALFIGVYLAGQLFNINIGDSSS